MTNSKMNPNNYVSRPIAWLLKAVGFPQNTEVCFDRFDTLTLNPVSERSAFDADAPTVAELFDALPLPSGGHDVPFLYTGISRGFREGTDKYFCKVSSGKCYTGDTMADAVGLAIYKLAKAQKLSFRPTGVDVKTDARTLKESLQEPELQRQRIELEKKMKDVPTRTVVFALLVSQLDELNVKIAKAKAQDELTLLQAFGNVGFPI